MIYYAIMINFVVFFNTVLWSIYALFGPILSFKVLPLLPLGSQRLFASTLKKTADDLRSGSRKFSKTVALCSNLGQMELER